MESMAYVYHSSPLAGAEFSTLGKLRLQQSMPLPHKGIHTIYNVSYLLNIAKNMHSFIAKEAFCLISFSILVLRLRS